MDPINVPQQMIANTGEDSLIWEEKDRFFGSIIESLNLHPFTLKYKTLEDYRTVHVINQSSPETNDQLVVLIVNDVLVASVMLRRNSKNWIEASFAHFLSDSTLSCIVKREPQS